MSDEQKILDRFIKLLTGRSCRARLSPSGLGLLTRHKVWPGAMRRVVELGTCIHWHSNDISISGCVWVGRYTSLSMTTICSSLVSILLPRYDGTSMPRYRGQRADEPVGVSWSRGYYNALKFALYGLDNVDPRRLHPAYRGPVPKPTREGTVVLMTEARTARIICAPCLLGEAEGEHILDPRGLKTRVIHGHAVEGRPPFPALGGHSGRMPRPPKVVARRTDEDRPRAIGCSRQLADAGN